MIFNNHRDYMSALTNYLNTPFSIINGEGFALVKGRLVPEDEYWANNSRPLYELKQKENPDSKNIAQTVVIRKYGRRKKV